MADQIELGDLGFDFNTFCRYMYGGSLLFIIETIIFNQQAVDLFHSLGKDVVDGVFIFFVALTIGTGFYVFYKISISECIIDRNHLEHSRFMWMHSNDRCAFDFLRKFVNERDIIMAFRLIRDSGLCDKTIMKVFFRRHSEVHVLYQTATIFLIGIISILLKSWFCQSIPSLWSFLLVSLSVGFYMLGFLADRNLCEDEYAYFRHIPKDKIEKILQDADLLLAHLRKVL